MPSTLPNTILIFIGLICQFEVTGQGMAQAAKFNKLNFRNNTKDTTKLRKEWVNIGAWFDLKWRTDFEGSNGGINYNRSFDKVLKNTFYQIGVQSASSVNLLGGPAQVYQSAGNFGIGKRYLHRYFLIAFFTGPGVIWGVAKEAGSYGTVGLASNLQIVAKPLKDVGIGVEVFNTLNLVRSLTGFRIVFHISSGI